MRVICGFDLSVLPPADPDDGEAVIPGERCASIEPGMTVILTNTD
jgi:hypothetical protein